MANAVVIGANGFLGSHLVDALVAKGHRVRAFDRYSTKQQHFSAQNVEVMRGEFLSRADLDTAVAGQDFVFHFLSTTAPITAETDASLDMRTNVEQTIELLKSCVRAKVSHVYFASTGGAIYGSQKKLSYTESDPALPVSPYGIGKLTIEHYLRYFYRLHGLRFSVFRIANPYGPRQHDNKLQGFIPISLRQIIRGEPVIVFGDGSMVRDYIYIDEAISMIVKIVASSPKYEIYNIGSGVGHTVNQVLSALAEVTGEDISVIHREAPATFIDHVVLNIERYQNEFGSIPIRSLVDGIRDTERGMGLLTR